MKSIRKTNVVTAQEIVRIVRKKKNVVVHAINVMVKRIETGKFDQNQKKSVDDQDPEIMKIKFVQKIVTVIGNVVTEKESAKKKERRSVKRNEAVLQTGGWYPKFWLFTDSMK